MSMYRDRSGRVIPVEDRINPRRPHPNRSRDRLGRVIPEEERLDRYGDGVGRVMGPGGVGPSSVGPDAVGQEVDNAQLQTELDAIEAEISELEQEIAQGPQVSTQQQFELPTAPPLPGAELLENPLLKAIQDDVTRRLMANQAARGKLGSGETALALQSALAPTALNLGLTQQAREQAQQQQNISNLLNLMNLGANVAGGQGTAAMQGASNIGSAYQSGGQARAAGELARGDAISGTIGGLAQLGGYFSSPTTGFSGAQSGDYGGSLFTPTAQGVPVSGGTYYSPFPQ